MRSVLADDYRNYIKFLKQKIRSESDDVTFLNPYSYVLFRKNIQELYGFRVEIDGILLAILLGAVLNRKIVRRSFDSTSLAPVIFENAERSGDKVAIIGSSEVAVQGFRENIERSFPKLNIVYSRNGFFDMNEDVDGILDQLEELTFDLLIVGMGSGRQEAFMRKARSRFEFCYKAFSCGGFIHQTINGMDYYPPLINKLQLRIFYRLFRERKLWRRHLKYYPLFLIYILIDAINYHIVRRGW